MLILLVLQACVDPSEDKAPVDTGDDIKLPDETPPSVSFVTPEPAAVLTGTYTVEGQASDNEELTRVVLELDSAVVMEFGAPPYTYELDTTLLPDGEHRLLLYAEDAAGNEDEAKRTFTTVNGSLSSESIEILEPDDDQTACGELRIEAFGTSEIVSATLFVNGEEKATRTDLPFRWTWDTAGRTKPPYDIAVMGTTASGVQIVDRVWVYTDTTGACDAPPVIGVISPDPGEWVSGEERVRLTATDAEGVVTQVRLEADGVPFATVSEDPWEADWDVTDLEDGEHVLTATGKDSAGQEVTTKVRVMVDQTAPTARITDPLNDDTVQGTYTIVATAEDTNGIESVEIFVDGTSLGKRVATPWEWEWDTTDNAGGVELELEAYDLTGQLATDSLDVYVDNPPSLTLDSPEDGDIVDGFVTWRATSTDDLGQPHVEIDIDGTVVSSDAARPFSNYFDSCEIASGAYTLTASASDDSGNVVSTSIGITIDQPTYIEHIGPARLEPNVTFEVWVADDETTSSVEWKIDGVSVGTSTAGAADPGACDTDCSAACTRFSLDYDASALAQGDHTVEIRATNATGSISSNTVTLNLDHDLDDDGYEGEVWGGSDCEDEDDTVSPGVAERCDSLDQDCDGDIDEDFDADLDGSYDRDYCDYGDDCDDEDAAVNPSAVEECDGIDNDCDDAIDVSGPPTTNSPGFASPTLTASFTAQAWGNVYSPSRDVILESVSFTFDPGSSPTVYQVFESDSSTGPFTRIGSATVSASGNYASYSSGELDLSLEAGKFYLVALGSDGTSSIRYERAPSLSAVGELTPYGVVKYTGGKTATEITDAPDSNLLLPQTLNLSYVLDDDADLDGDGENVYCGDCDDSDDRRSSLYSESCDGVDSDCDGAVPSTEADADADGALVCDDDCDDSDADRYPTATELCDGIDNDCDGAVTEDESDVDGDGVAACQLCVGSACTMDCNDSDPSTLLATFYTDADGDGYGSDATASTSCPPTAEEVTVGGDCDDDTEAVSPAETESCNGVDDDCNGVADDGFDADGDGYGDCLDCDDGDATVSPAAAEVCGDSIDDDCNGTAELCRFEGEVAITDANYLATGASSDDTLSFVASLDFNDDGWVDTVFATPYVNNGGSDYGAVYLHEGPLSGDVSVDSGLRLLGESTGDYLGCSLSAGSDLDGDGLPDVLTGASSDDDGGAGAGAGYLIPGAGAVPGSVATSAYKIVGENSGDAFGSAVAILADLNGDGDADLLFGAPNSDRPATNAGAGYLFYGPLTASVDSSTADFEWTGESTSDLAGTRVGSAGDLNGDGLTEALVGAPSDDDGASAAGAVYIVSEPTASGSLSDYIKITGTASSLELGENIDPDPAGDLDGDGLDDLALGSGQDDTAATNAGAAWIFYGPVSASTTTDQAEAMWFGVAASDAAGSSVIGGGDLDLDGAGELVIGAPGESTHGTSAGATYLVYGASTGSHSLADADAVFYGESPGDTLGAFSAFTPDLDGDGASDLWLLARTSDLAYSGAGAGYLFTGGP